MTASHLASNTVMHTLQRLDDQGQIRRDGGKRLIALVQSQDTVSLVAASLRRRGFWIEEPQLTPGWAYVKACKANGEVGR